MNDTLDDRELDTYYRDLRRRTRPVKFSEDQPRDDRGRWTDSGLSTMSSSDPSIWTPPTPDPETGLYRYMRAEVVHTNDINLAVRMIQAGQLVELPDTRHVYTLLRKLAELTQQAKALGEQAPNYDLCKVQVANTSIFCVDHVATPEHPAGIPRIAMPQFSGLAVAGSRAADLPKDAKGEVNVAAHFREYLGQLNVRTTELSMPAAHLRASQNELVGTKVAGMMLNEQFDPAREAIFVSRDNYVIDGHHRWATAVGRESATGSLGQFHMPVIKIDMPISEVLHLANQWTKDFGLAPKAAKRWVDAVQKWEESQHPRDEHGQFTSAGGSAGGDVTQTHAFKAWWKESQVVDEDGKPKVVYHGTTHPIEEEFYPAGSEEIQNVESDWGAGIYFTDERDDLDNYAGEGPDLTQRIELRAEELEGQDDALSRADAEAQARAELSGGAPQVIPVYLSMQTPFQVGGDHETRLTSTPVYENPDDPDSDIIDEEGTLVDLVAAIREEAHGFDDTKGVLDTFIPKVMGYGGDITASQFDKLWRETPETGYVTDEKGRLAGNELLRRAIERAGFDGIIDHTVYDKFGANARRPGMGGLYPETTHYIAFQPTQIKSALGNNGNFDPNDRRYGKLYDEALHPRDERGQWTDAEGSSLTSQLVKPDGGFTYSALTHTSPTTGYALSIHKDRERIVPVAQTDAMSIYRYVKENWDLLGQAGNHIGAWHNPEDGQVYFDVSTVVQSADEAERLGRAHSQLAYFDLSRGQSVSIKGWDDVRQTSIVPHRQSADASRHLRADRSLDRSQADAGGTRGSRSPLRGRTQAHPLIPTKFSQDQPRDELGRWTDAGAGETSSANYFPDSVIATVQAEERKIREQPIEYGVFIDPRDGTVSAAFTDGKPNYISLPNALIPGLQDKIFTHNHPSGNSLSKDDVLSAQRFNMLAIRSVSPGGTNYMLRRTDTSWPDNFQSTITDIEQRQYTEWKMAISTGAMDVLTASATHFDTLWQKVEKAFPGEIVYTRDQR